MKEIFLLVSYWFIAGASFIVPSAILKSQNWLVLAGAITLLCLTTVSIFFLSKFLKDYRSRVPIVLLPVILSSACSFLILWLMDTMVTRFIVLAVLVPVFVGVFNFVLYFEDVGEVCHSHRELIHRRYLEYARSFFWGIAIIILSYLAWELQARGGTAEDVGIPWALPNFIEVMQLVGVIGFGGALTFLGFHTKLNQIERLNEVS